MFSAYRHTINFLAIMVLVSCLSGSCSTSAATTTIDLSTAELPQQVIDSDLEYADVMAYLDHRFEVAEQNRSAYWAELDTSSLAAYEQSITPYREDFQDLIGLPEECSSDNIPELLSDDYVTTTGDVEIRFWTLAVCDGALTSYALVGIPITVNEPMPLIVAIHGTCGSPERLMGLQADDYHHRFGLYLAEKGYFVYAPLITTIPTVDSGQCKQPTNEQRNQLHHRSEVLGDQLIGIEVGKLVSALDYLVMQQQIDPDSIGAYGISLGGLLAFAFGAIDERLEVTVVSQYIEDRPRKLAGRDYPSALWAYEYTDYNFLDDHLQYFTDLEQARLIVPRKLFIEVGNEDPRAIFTEQLAPEFESNYMRLGLPADYLAIEIGDGGHEIFLNGSLVFPDHWLKEN